MTAPVVAQTYELWAYAGVRQLREAGYLVDTWRPLDPKLMAMTSRVRSDRALYVIGKVYRVKVTRQTPTHAVRESPPKITPDWVTEELQVVWAAEDSAARLAVQLKREEERRAMTDAIDAALAPLQGYMATHRKYPQREALFCTLMRRIMQDVAADDQGGVIE